MNIFILSEDPVVAAQQQCDAHVIKMILESAQMLSTASYLLFPSENVSRYRPAYGKHPCTLWASASYANFRWLCYHGRALSREFRYRYGDHKLHASENIILGLYSLCRNAPRDAMTPFALAMPDEFRHVNPVTAYRRYYQFKKQTLPRFTYTKRAIPEWLL